MCVVTKKKTLDNIIQNINKIAPKNLKEAFIPLIAGFFLLNSACNPPRKISRHRRAPLEFRVQEPEYPNEFQIDFKSLNRNPYVQSIEDKFKENYKNLKRAHHLAMLDIFYKDLKNVLPPNIPDPEYANLFKELLTLNIDKDSTRINQIYDIAFSKRSPSIGIENKFRKEIEKRVKFGINYRDFHDISGFLRLGIGDLARYGYLIGGDIALTKTGDDFVEFDFVELRKQTGWGRIKFTRDKVTGAYKANISDEAIPMLINDPKAYDHRISSAEIPILGGKTFTQWEAENITNKVVVADSAKTLDKVNIVQYQFPIGNDCIGVRFDIYGNKTAIQNKNNTSDYSIKIVVTNLEKIIASSLIEKKELLPKGGRGFHIGFDEKIYCINPDQKDSTIISVGCEFTNKQNKKLVRSKQIYTLSNEETPHYNARLIHPDQKDNQSKYNIPNIALPTKVENTAKFIIPVKDTAGTIDIYLIDYLKKEKTVKSAYSSIQFSALEDSVTKRIAEGRFTPGEGIYLGSFPFNSSDGFVKINAPMKYTNQYQKEKDVPAGMYKAIIFVNKDGKLINTASMDRFVKK